MASRGWDAVCGPDGDTAVCVALPEVMGELPCACLAEEIETPGDGQIRALITIAGNPVLSTPNGARLARALESLECMISLDIYLNETTRHADVILPGLSPLEESHYDPVFTQFAYRNAARYSPPVFAPPDRPAAGMADVAAAHRHRIRTGSGCGRGHAR